MMRAVDKYQPGRYRGCYIALFISLFLLLPACKKPSQPASEPTLVEKGEQIFLNETFGGNGRTCGTCHRQTDNFGLSPAFIAT